MLFDMVEDSSIAAGSDAFSAALSIYNSAKSGVSGTDAIVNDLKQQFEKSSGTSGVPEYKSIIAS